MKSKVTEAKEVVETKFQEKIVELQAIIDETNAVNTQIRDESEALEERVSQLKEEMRLKQEEFDLTIEMKETSFKESLDEV